MKIKMLVSMAGAEAINVGDERDVDDAEAKRLIEAGYAMPIAIAAKGEGATKAKPAGLEQR